MANWTIPGRALSFHSFDVSPLQKDRLHRNNSDLTDKNVKSRSLALIIWNRFRTQEALNESNAQKIICTSKKISPFCASLPVDEVKRSWRNQQIAKQQDLIREQGTFWNGWLFRRGNALNLRHQRP
jgi:hypothetical protein